MLVAVIPHVMHEFVIFHEMDFRSHYTYAYANTIIRHERQSMHACNIPEVWSHGAIDNDHVLTASPIALWPYYYQWCPHKPVIRILQQPQRLSSSASLVGANYHDCSVNQACRARTTVIQRVHNDTATCYVSLLKHTTFNPLQHQSTASRLCTHQSNSKSETWNHKKSKFINYTNISLKLQQSTQQTSFFAFPSNGHQLSEKESTSYRTEIFIILLVSRYCQFQKQITTAVLLLQRS